MYQLTQNLLIHGSDENRIQVFHCRLLDYIYIRDKCYISGSYLSAFLFQISLFSYIIPQCLWWNKFPLRIIVFVMWEKRSVGSAASEATRLNCVLCAQYTFCYSLQNLGDLKEQSPQCNYKNPCNCRLIFCKYITCCLSSKIRHTLCNC